jgi:hypothetical protein
LSSGGIPSRNSKHSASITALTLMPWLGKLTAGRDLLEFVMATTTFDTLKFANTLKAAGVPDKQAEAQASVLGEALAVNFKELATKEDLIATKVDLTAAIGSVRTDLGNDIRRTEQRLDAKIDNLAAKFDGQLTLLKWMIGLSISLNIAVLIRLFLTRIP